ncbi:hypothetical protein PASE110613_17695 [Paenibacillus sediminis]|uniref:Uncharacterized protein n=1 Tax=Paenibacillus sediminis TaxID=664909 RepID=A0ABS4H219_9BACL|nr:hypothetical protein [Paenibacillus sediminis]MBP1936583.1 hypothetical protein [Paenibacillus sediminis]
MKADNLNIPIYLNQQIVFDLLAILEDGFSRFRAVRSMSNDSESKDSKLSAGINASNLFSLLGISLSGSLGKSSKNDNQNEISEERVHTPASLFSKLRSALQEQDTIKTLTLKAIEAGDIKTGDFIEFEGILRKNPMVEAIQIFVKVFETFLSFTESSQGQSKNKHLNKRGTSENEIVLEQMKAVLSDLTQSKSIDLIADIDKEVRAVLACNMEYFNDIGSNEIIDGSFKILGKVVRVVNTNESINLLRKTSFGIFSTETISEMVENFNKASENGLNIPEIITNIEGPVIQIIPVAIFA